MNLTGSWTCTRARSWHASHSFYFTCASLFISRFRAVPLPITHLAYSHICFILMYAESVQYVLFLYIRTALLQVPWDTGKVQPLVVEAFEKGLFTAPVQAPFHHSVGNHFLTQLGCAKCCKRHFLQWL